MLAMSAPPIEHSLSHPLRSRMYSIRSACNHEPDGRPAHSPCDVPRARAGSAERKCIRQTATAHRMLLAASSVHMLPSHSLELVSRRSGGGGRLSQIPSDSTPAPSSSIAQQQGRAVDIAHRSSSAEHRRPSALAYAEWTSTREAEADSVVMYPLPPAAICTHGGGGGSPVRCSGRSGWEVQGVDE